MKMKKVISLLTVCVFLAMTGVVMANTPPPVANASGNFDIDTFAIGGGVDGAFTWIPNGSAGGMSGAGGFSAGEASGEFASIIFGWCHPTTITFGGTGADLESHAGGLTNTEAGMYQPTTETPSIGVYSASTSYGTTGGSLHVDAWGIAESHGAIYGAAGQGSTNISSIGGSPLHAWDSDGLSIGIVGQGSVGGFAGAGLAAGLGSADVSANIDMYGNTYTESYRILNGNTEIMGTNVGASTMVVASGNVDQSCIGGGVVNGGYVAAGGASTTTVQTTQNGFAKANAVGAYNGSGALNTTFNGSATGYTQTSATTQPGMTGSIMTSSAGMHVSNTPVLQ